MYRIFFKYYKYLIILLFLYLLLSLLRNLLNIYSLLIIIITLAFFYNKNRRLFKKIAYKLIFKRKTNFSIKNKYGAAKNSLEAVDKINKKISNKIEAELLKFEKYKI